MDSITLGWAEKELSSVREKRDLLDKQTEHLQYMIEILSSGNPPSDKLPVYPFNLGAVAGTVELLKKEEGRWLNKHEISEAFRAGGYQSKAKDMAEAIASTLNFEIRDKLQKGEPPRVIRKNGSYGLPQWSA